MNSTEPICIQTKIRLHDWIILDKYELNLDKIEFYLSGYEPPLWWSAVL